MTNIVYTSVRIFSKIFNEEYYPLRKLTKMAFSTQENVIYGKNIFLCASVFCILLYEEYLPLCELTNMVFSMLENVICQKNIHICANILTYTK